MPESLAACRLKTVAGWHINYFPSGTPACALFTTNMDFLVVLFVFDGVRWPAGPCLTYPGWIDFILCTEFTAPLFVSDWTLAMPCSSKRLKSLKSFNNPLSVPQIWMCASWHQHAGLLDRRRGSLTVNVLCCICSSLRTAHHIGHFPSTPAPLTVCWVIASVCIRLIKLLL